MDSGRDVLFSGYLRKQGHWRKNWKKRYFRISSVHAFKQKEMAYFPSCEVTTAIESHWILSVEKWEGKGEMKGEMKHGIFVRTAAAKSYYLEAEDESQQLRFLEAARGEAAELSVRIIHHDPSTGECLIHVTHRALSWEIQKTHADFKQLDESLSNPIEEDVAGQGPRLPWLTLSNDADKLLELNEYLQQLVLHPDSARTVEVLSFLGMLSTARAAEGAEQRESDVYRPVVHLSKLASFVRTGDVVLGHTNDPLATIQRVVTGQYWDHVGVVMHSYYSSTSRSMTAALLRN
jgi:hypothetical protein